MHSPITSSDQIARHIQQIQQRIKQLCGTYKRPPTSVSLLAVSKTRTADDIRAAYNAGQSDFGENYLQEALDKIQLLGDINIHWHFIGAIQSNKTRDIALHFDWVHSVDRLKIAQRLSDQRPENLTPLQLCLQINISHEPSKNGMTPQYLKDNMADFMALKNVQIRGLMAIPAAETDFQKQRISFSHMHQLLLDLQRDYPQLDTLSMGMSQDMEAAIAEGSTLVRIGTAIFGQRETAI